MKILFLYSSVIQISDIIWPLIELGHQVDQVDLEVGFEFENQEKETQLEQLLQGTNYDFLISYNFMPVVSNVCDRMHLKYVSWVFDSPVLFLYHWRAYRECNYIFMFDRDQYEKLKEQPFAHLYYLPLGVNLSRIGAIEITQEDEKEFSGEISFIGSTYKENEYHLIADTLPEKIANSMENSIQNAFDQYEGIPMSEYVTKEQIEYFDQVFGQDNIRYDLDMDAASFYGDFYFSREVATRERFSALEKLAKVGEMTFYTHQKDTKIPGVHVKGGVNYETTMVKIFYLSKINLNMTIPSITSGLPLRVWDILGAGGFLLTNYQKELDDYFEENVDYVCYHNEQEMIEKAKYYLNHEEERLAISLNGYKKVRDHHTYLHRMQQMLKMLEEK